MIIECEDPKKVCLICLFNIWFVLLVVCYCICSLVTLSIALSQRRRTIVVVAVEALITLEASYFPISVRSVPYLLFFCSYGGRISNWKFFCRI